MTQWVLTVAGIALLSVLADVVLPEGQTRKYVKTVMGIVVTFVLVQPALALITGQTVPAFAHKEITVQENYVNYAQAESSAESIRRALNKQGFVATVKFDGTNYVATLFEEFSQSRLQQAQSATQNYSNVQFVWNRSG